jgi:hypothetical protein
MAIGQQFPRAAREGNPLKSEGTIEAAALPQPIGSDPRLPPPAGARSARASLAAGGPKKSFFFCLLPRSHRAAAQGPGSLIRSGNEAKPSACTHTEAVEYRYASAMLNFIRVPEKDMRAC